MLLISSFQKHQHAQSLKKIGGWCFFYTLRCGFLLGFNSVNIINYIA